MAATGNTNTEFELRGITHLALVCRDMAETVAWYGRERAWVAAVRSGEYRAYYERMYGQRLRDSRPAVTEREP